MGQFQWAIEDYDQAIRLDPQFPLAYANRALAYTVIDRDLEAQRNADRAAELGFDPALLKRMIEEAVATTLHTTLVSNAVG